MLQEATERYVQTAGPLFIAVRTIRNAADVLERLFEQSVCRYGHDPGMALQCVESQTLAWIDRLELCLADAQLCFVQHDLVCIRVLSVFNVR